MIAVVLFGALCACGAAVHGIGEPCDGNGDCATGLYCARDGKDHCAVIETAEAGSDGATTTDAAGATDATSDGAPPGTDAGSDSAAAASCTGAASCADAYEPNDGFTSATLLAFGVTIVDAGLCLGDDDFYAFDASAPVRLHLESAGAEALDCSVFNEGMPLLDCVPGTVIDLDVPALAGETLQLVVWSFGGLGSFEVPTYCVTLLPGT